MVAGLFLEINALIIALIIAMFVLHEATGWWDIGYASTAARPQLPRGRAAVAALLVIVLHWGQFLGTMAAAIVLEIVPYSEELLRCLKATDGRLVPQRVELRKR